MSFIWPAMLIFLLLVPISGVLYLRWQRRRRALIERYGSLGLMQTATGQPFGARRHIPVVLFLLGLTILLISLARPQMVVSLPHQEGTVILAFDVSGSMAADDIQPTRMDAAKAAAIEFVQRQPPSVLVGVVAFSDSGFAIQAPTNDQNVLFSAINRLEPQRGTSLGQGIRASLNTIAVSKGEAPRMYSTLETTPTPVSPGTNTSTVIVLLTDGENNEMPDPQEAAQEAADRGVRVFTVGVGSPAGTIVRANGFSVHTQLDAAALQQIAQITDGAYYSATDDEQLRSIYQNLDLQFVVKPEPIEITALLALMGLGVVLIGAICSMLWFSRVP